MGVAGGALSNSLTQIALASNTEIGGAQTDKGGGSPSLLLCVDKQFEICNKLYVETVL
jgi:hypothetical protein